MLSILLGSTGHVFLSRISIKWQKRAFRSYTIQHHSGKIRVFKVFPHALYKNNAHIQWLEKNKEVEINGHRYDIVARSLKNGITTFYILEDVHENTLLSFGLQQARQQNKALQYIQILLGMNYLQPGHTFFPEDTLLQYFAVSFKNMHILYSDGFLNNLNRPPVLRS